jgi:chromosome segregation ATPase
MTVMEVLEWLKLIIGGAMVLVLPVVIYYVKNEVKLSAVDLWERVAKELDKHYSFSKKEVQFLESRLEYLKDDQSVLASRQAILDLQITHISEKLDSIDKKLDRLAP